MKPNYKIISFIICLLLFSLSIFAQQVDTFYNFPTRSQIKGIDWVTTPQAGGLSCMLERDDSSSIFVRRNLILIYLLRDSALVISLRLDSGMKYKYALFPLMDGEKRLLLYEDTALIGQQIIIDTGKGQSLMTAYVTRRKDKRGEMDHLYASGSFSEPTLYSYETWNEPFYDLGSFLRSRCPRIQGGYGSSDTPTDVLGHKVLFYLNEQNVQWNILSVVNFRSIAYVKCFESENVADDADKFMNGMYRGFTFDSVKGSPLKVPTDRAPFIVAIYTYDYPATKFRKKRKK